MKNRFSISFIAILFIAAAVPEECDKCTRKEECIAFGNLNQEAQDAWQVKFPCSPPTEQDHSTLFGFAPVAKGDYVCCSNAIWGATGKTSSDSVSTESPAVGSRNGYDNYFNQPNDYDQSNYNNGYYPNSRTPNRYDFVNNRPRNNNGWNSGRYNGNGGYNNNNYIPNQGYQGYGYDNSNTQSPRKNYFNENNNPYVTSSPFFVNNNGYSNQAGQCPVTSFPPAPESGCCGIEATDPDRIIGGRETELEQFPWTVLLKVTFDYGDKRSAFNCGGSLISSRYVLTAGHCVYDEGGKIIDVDVYLAEYDKRTFPKDCKFVLGQGQKCIENIVMKAYDVTLHPQYEDSQLNNDIALIRLESDAPYTDYIRPICLPSIDIDTPEFSNLRLAVAGWGRNGKYRSDIKQSTVVNLVPQQKCKSSYPGLTRSNLCAAGYTGQDTCKGDSGGPLMTVYGGKYEVVGVVSGKRADAPCGTSVPSLYTSVYHYLDWIRSSMKA